MSTEAAPDVQHNATGSGAILKQARESRGLHISVLATSLRVPVERIRALEGEKWSDLPDLVFARALAMSVCRHLKIDPAPVLAGMPDPDPLRSVRVTAAISQPLAGVVSGPTNRRTWWTLLPLLVLALAAWVYMTLDADTRPTTTVETPGMPPASQTEAPVPADAPVKPADGTPPSDKAEALGAGPQVMPAPSVPTAPATKP